MEQDNSKKTVKLTDKAFSRLLITSVFAILGCVVFLCSTTWAWFSDSAPSRQNEIRMADKCLLTVTLECDGTELTNIENGILLEAGEVYVVTLTLPKDSASGYCILTADGEKYYSDYIASHDDPTPKTLTFTLRTETTKNVTFTNKWGIYSRESSVVNGELLIP